MEAGRVGDAAGSELASLAVVDDDSHATGRATGGLATVDDVAAVTSTTRTLSFGCKTRSSLDEDRGSYPSAAHALGGEAESREECSSASASAPSSSTSMKLGEAARTAACDSLPLLARESGSASVVATAAVGASATDATAAAAAVGVTCLVRS